MTTLQDPDRTRLDNLAERARRTGPLGTLMHAVERAGLEPTLARLGPLTVFAPSDEAFAQLPDGTVDSLLSDPVKLNQVLTYHLVPGVILAGEVTGRRRAPTVNGESLPLSLSLDGCIHVDGAHVVAADLEAANGVIHVIDRVLLPAMM
jgi:transforming growth factor-beta-induced protein